MAYGRARFAADGRDERAALVVVPPGVRSDDGRSSRSCVVGFRSGGAASEDVLDQAEEIEFLLGRQQRKE